MSRRKRIEEGYVEHTREDIRKGWFELLQETGLMDNAWLIEHRQRLEIYYWKKDRQGYTANILKAGLYTEEEATQQAERRAQDYAVKLTDMLPHNTDGTVFGLIITTWKQRT